MRKLSRVLPVVLLVAGIGWVRTGGACGLTPPIGANGLPAVCQGDEPWARFRAGAALGGTMTEIDFGDETADLTQGAATATFDVFPTERLGFSAALGATLPGRLDYAGERYDLLPGPAGGLGVSYRFLGGRLPFVHTTVTFALARSTTRAEGAADATFTSRDWRFGVAVGTLLGGWAAPYAVARYFGAGTDWPVAGGKGSDAHRYHVGAGSAFALSQRFDVLTELAFLGERRATVGVGYSF